VTQVIINIVDHGMNIQQAIDWPRVHHQWMPDQITYEPFGLAPDVLTRLNSMGHKFIDKPRQMGDCEGVMIEDETGVRLGGRDPRLDGHSIGY
jgi:gamma-glutamyltranspeptidase/glutathione hydrolase